jgi:hypothetical protein
VIKSEAYSADEPAQTSWIRQQVFHRGPEILLVTSLLHACDGAGAGGGPNPGWRPVVQKISVITQRDGAVGRA